MKTSKNYNRLVELQAQYPKLTYNNTGYENLPENVMISHKKIIEEISNILKEEMPEYFVRFQNFKPRRDGSIAIRCQVIYDHVSYFQGVDYIPITDFK